MAMQTHHVENGTLTYEVTGQGDPVLLVHGALGQLEIWATIVEELSTTHRVLAYDRRGNGRSPNPTADCRVHAADAAALVSDVLEEPATVVGYSSGGSIALALALAQPSLVRRLVLIEPPWHLLRPPSIEALRVFGKAQYRYLRGRERAAAEGFLRWVLGRQSGGSAWDDAPEELKDLVLGNAGAFKIEGRPHARDQMLNHVSAKSVANCNVPVTYLLGEDSRPQFHRSHRSLSKALPMVHTVRVPEATHLLPYEAPSAVVGAARAGTASPLMRRAAPVSWRSPGPRPG